jgi:cytochrome b561
MSVPSETLLMQPDLAAEAGLEAYRYHAVARALHWTMAGLILVVFALGLIVDVFPRGVKPLVVEVHKDLGVTILVLLAARLVWRLVRRPPPYRETLSPLIERMSGLGHLGLYALMLAVPVTGLLYLFWRGQGLDLGLFSVASPFAADRSTARSLREVHEFAAYALIGFSALHAAAALWHHVVLKDSVLQRMLPSR